MDVKVSSWPDDANELVLDVMSVEPTAAYDFTSFSFPRPAGDPPYSLTRTGRLLLHYPIAFYARPLQFTYRARFLPEGHRSQVRVEGHRHLRMQCFDPAREPQSGYALVDNRVSEIEISCGGAIADAELNDFLLILAVMGGVAGQYLQDNTFCRAIF